MKNLINRLSHPLIALLALATFFGLMQVNLPLVFVDQHAKAFGLLIISSKDHISRLTLPIYQITTTSSKVTQPVYLCNTDDLEIGKLTWLVSYFERNKSQDATFTQTNCQPTQQNLVCDTNQTLFTFEAIALLSKTTKGARYARAI